jgi:Tetracyclin repressor-like, C-terminal domain
LIRDFVVTALEQHELSADEDPDALTFELNGIILAANSNFVLRQDPAALDIARTVVRRRLGITTTSSPLPQRRAPTRSPKKTRGNEPNATPRRTPRR